jgi:regulation of enolase protein 1 (concanavalin A-like superfamily)
VPRSVASLLCAAVACAAFAAPAPVYKPERTRWLGMSGWDKPIDPVGDCLFDRGGGRLTIGARPGKDRSYSQKSAPHLLREVEGDFVLRVRVGGEFEHDRRGGYRSAGILMVGGESYWMVQRMTYFTKSGNHGFKAVACCEGRMNSEWLDRQGLHGSASGYVRLARKGDEVELEASEDGKTWRAVMGRHRIKGLANTLRVGVVVESRTREPFKPVFDQFSLTPLK